MGYDRLLKILVLGAHPDDIEFGCGGTLNQLKGNEINCVILSNTLNYPGNDGIVKELSNSMNYYCYDFRLLDFTNMNFNGQFGQICQTLYDLKQEFKPEHVYCTNPKSVNPDHSVLGKAVEAVFQECSIFYFDLLRGDYNSKPNYFRILTQQDVDKKLMALNMYTSQKPRIYADPDLILAHMMYRGGQIGKKYAEAFEVGRIIQ